MDFVRRGTTRPEHCITRHAERSRPWGFLEVTYLIQLVIIRRACDKGMMRHRSSKWEKAAMPRVLKKKKKHTPKHVGRGNSLAWCFKARSQSVVCLGNITPTRCNFKQFGLSFYSHDSSQMMILFITFSIRIIVAEELSAYKWRCNCTHDAF